MFDLQFVSGIGKRLLSCKKKRKKKKAILLYESYLNPIAILQQLLKNAKTRTFKERGDKKKGSKTTSTLMTCTNYSQSGVAKIKHLTKHVRRFI